MKNYTEIAHWIEKIIISSTTPEHERVCLKLVELFTVGIINDKTYHLNGQLSHHLYKILFKKFLFKN